MISYISGVVGVNQGLNSTEDSLARLRKKQADRQESELARVKSFFQRNTGRFLAAGLLVIVPAILALFPGIGFTATVHISSSRPLIRGHRCRGVPVVDCRFAAGSCACLEGWVYEGIVNVTFSPHLYPVNHLFRNEVSTNVIGRCGTTVSEASFKESLITQTVLSEFPINIPLFYAVGFILTVGLEKTTRKSRCNSFD